MTTDAEAEALRERLNEACQRDPKEFPFGAFTGDDYPLSQVALFHWFRDSTELLDAIAECEPAVYLDPAQTEYHEVSRRLTEIRDSARPDDQLGAELMSQFQAVLKDMCACLSWWGSLSDLISGDGEFERRVREDFHEGFDEQEADSRSIEPERVDDFIDFLREYGI